MIAAGARTPTEIACACGAGADCGGCSAMLEELIRAPLDDARATFPRAACSSPQLILRST
jgi:bacterioferritin-associated ferredoxin